MTTAPSPGEPDPDLVAAIVLSCPAVAGLHPGPFGEVATYLPGRRVSGVRVRPGAVEVHVIGRYPIPVPEIEGQVRAAIAAAGPSPVQALVVVEDYAAAVDHLA
ncbi:hypothetical protein EV383_5983 [Pseudonocardia sediminis]|uniref:Uncharacterized protein n=1 Tax=Pseudonocardia sediminis TaxID=1397368 RepID=A0A4Q7V8A3_PSEST|nr:Asp23/Gls24 family envelope stress response protein [Pseudonocardia sediminis]RZT89029.1 hypothetical protein EV383_5983 [Pseudonocardia sediminis]